MSETHDKFESGCDFELDGPDKNGWTTEEVLADLRARAEKEAER